MFVAPDVRRALDGPWEDDEIEARCGFARREFDRFIEGGWISLALDPFHKKPYAYMAAIAPVRDRVFDVRVRAPEAGLRVFGCFAFTDTFVALNWELREKMPTSDEWRTEREICKARWTNLFHTFEPHQGASIHDYVSDKVIPA